MSRKMILLVLVALLSAFVVQNATIQSVNARYIDEVPVPNSKIPHKYVYFDEARNYFMPSFLAGNKGGSVIDLSSVSEKEPGVYIALKSQWWYKDDYIEPGGYVYIRTLDEKNNKYQYGFDKTSYGPDRWFDLSPVYALDVQLIIKKVKENGSANNNSQNKQPKIDPSKVDLMKCWQEDVDACTLEDGSMLTVYDGMPEAEVKNNFTHWQVKNCEYHPETKSSLEYISYSMERGNNQLREVLRIYKIPDQNTVVPWGITFSTNQRLLARQIFDRFKKNLSALYEENSWNKERTRLLYSTYDHYMVGHLTLDTDYKKDTYSVTWSGMAYAD